MITEEDLRKFCVENCTYKVGEVPVLKHWFFGALLRPAMYAGDKPFIPEILALLAPPQGGVHHEEVLTRKAIEIYLSGASAKKDSSVEMRMKLARILLDLVNNCSTDNKD